MTRFPARKRAAALILFAAATGPVLAAPATDSAYLTDPQSTHVEDQTSQGIGEVNMIACIMAAMRPDALVNQGNYLALIDKNKCDSEKSVASGGAGSDGAQAASYLTSTVNSTRASNSDPMIVKAWIDLSEEEMQATVFVHISATEAPTTANPYGVFRLDFCGRNEALPGCMMNGYLEGADSGLSFYETEGDGGQARTTALRLTTAGANSGSGRMQMASPEGDGEFTFAYDGNYFLRSDGTQDLCFARDATDADTGQSVWRYGLYDATTGARVERNSGFPIEFTAGGTTYHGFLGYYGLSLPPDAAGALHSGDTVQKVDYSSGNNPTRTDYTVFQAAGKLVKYTRHSRTLHEMDQISFNLFVGDDAASFFAGATPFTQYVLHWDDTSGTFIATAQMNCNGGNGCQTQDLDSEKTIPLAYWSTRGGVQAWSDALGGEIFINLQGVSDPINSGSVQVAYRSQDLVYPADLPAALHCLRECPTAASLAAFFADGSPEQSPFDATTFNNWNPVVAGGIVHYTTNSTTGLLVDGASANVTFNDAAAFTTRPQYQWGVRSGRLFTNGDLASVECAPSSGTYCDYKVNDLDVYYQWETGPNSWNQFAAVKDSGGAFVNFDPPLQVTFNVPTGASYGDYAGKSIVLQYGGFGDLWGIPGVCVSRSTNEPVPQCDEHSRFVPQFVVPFDQTTGVVTEGSNTYLVKWLDREIRFAKKDIGVCQGAGLDLPGGVTLPTTADLRDPSDPGSVVSIGDKPAVTEAARVIHGDVKY